MKNILTIALTAFVITSAVFSTGSCTLKSDMIYSTQVTFVDKSYQGFPYYFVSDDSVRMVPSNGSSFSISEIDGRKMEISWKTQEQDLTKDPITIEVTGYSTLPQIEATQSDRPDTLGTDQAGLYLYNDVTPYLYKTGGIYDARLNLNAAFYYCYGDAGATHSLYLAYTSSPVDGNGYFHLKFCHDAGDDTCTQTSVTSFSFLLPPTAYSEGVKGVILDFDGLGETPEPESWKLTYATGKVEQLVKD